MAAVSATNLKKHDLSQKTLVGPGDTDLSVCLLNFLITVTDLIVFAPRQFMQGGFARDVFRRGKFSHRLRVSHTGE